MREPTGLTRLSRPQDAPGFAPFSRQVAHACEPAMLPYAEKYMTVAKEDAVALLRHAHPDFERQRMRTVIAQTRNLHVIADAVQIEGVDRRGFRPGRRAAFHVALAVRIFLRDGLFG